MFNFFPPSVPQEDADTIKQALDAHESCVILDVRTPEEYAKGHLSGSINIPVDRVESKIERTVPNKGQTIYVYCLSGSRSAQAVAAMRALGYSTVFEMKSGLLAWRAKGYPLVI